MDVEKKYLFEKDGKLPRGVVRVREKGCGED